MVNQVDVGPRDLHRLLHHSRVGKDGARIRRSMLPRWLMRREEERLHRVKVVWKAGLRIGELEGRILLLGPRDADTPAGGHHHRLDHVDLVPRDVGGSSERLEGRSLELEGDCTSSIDEHVKPASRSGQSETIVGGASAPINAHTNSDDPLKEGIGKYE